MDILDDNLKRTLGWINDPAYQTVDESKFIKRDDTISIAPSTKNCNSRTEINIISVRWFDGYLEEFRTTESRFGSDLLWMRLEDGSNRHIPLRMVRWFGMSKESHASK